MKKIISIIIVIVILALAIAVWQSKSARAPEETPYLGNALEKSDLIILSTPRPNDVIKSPLIIKGQARGNWFFEASFPVTLLDSEGNVLVEYYATAQDEWMTPEFVPFETVLVFENPESAQSGTLILKKDNASGLPEHDDSLIVPIRFEAQ